MQSRKEIIRMQAAEGPVEEVEGEAPAEEVVDLFTMPEWMPEPIVQAWEWLTLYPLIGFLVLVVLSLVGAKISEWVLTRWLARLASKTTSDLDDKIIAVSRRPIFLAVFFGGLSLAVRVLNPDSITGPISRLLGLVTLVAISFVVAKVVELVVCYVLAQLAERTSTDLDDQLIRLVQAPIFITVFFGGLVVTVRRLGIPPDFTLIVERLLETMAVLVWMRAAFPFAHLLLEGLSRVQDRFQVIEERTIPLFDIVTKLLILGGGSYALLAVWGIDPTPWIASAGVVGIAVGFAAKDTLANLFAGFFIVADTPYKIGDFVNLDSGERGMVTHVGIRSTRLETRDDVEITLPNAAIANSKIINESGGKWVKERIRIKVGVAYGSDVDQVCELLEEIAVRHDHICPSPTPRVRMRGFGDSSLDFELLCWIDEPVLRGKLSHELYMDVYKTFQKEGVEIPFPQQDVYVRQFPGKATGSEQD